MLDNLELCRRLPDCQPPPPRLLLHNSSIFFLFRCGTTPLCCTSQDDRGRKKAKPESSIFIIGYTHRHTHWVSFGRKQVLAIPSAYTRDSERHLMHSTARLNNIPMRYERQYGDEPKTNWIRHFLSPCLFCFIIFVSCDRVCASSTCLVEFFLLFIFVQLWLIRCDSWSTSVWRYLCFLFMACAFSVFLVSARRGT